MSTLVHPSLCSQVPQSMASSSCASSSSSTVSLVGLHRYVKLEKLGEGNYGCVYKARDKENGEIVALKKIKLSADDEGVPSTALREIALLQDLHHPNVISLHDVIFEQDKLYLSFPFLDKDLRRYMDCCGELPAMVTKYFIHQILQGLEACHNRRILHRDLKPQNVLVDRKGEIKIADFGLARTWNHGFMKTITHEVATLWYRAPEILMGIRTYTAAVDLWSIGCILAELSNDDPLFPGDSEIATLFLMFQLLGTCGEQNWPGVSSLPDFKATFPQWQMKNSDHWNQRFPKLGELGIDLLKRMLTFDPAKRVTATAALRHPYFADLNPQLAIEQSIELSKQLDTNDGSLRRAQRHARHR
jgi:cyclin-dependent kinase 2